MKASIFLPPAAALAIVAVWTGLQRNSIATVERRSDELRKAIASARATGAVAAGEDPRTPGRPVAGAAAERIVWAEVARDLAEAQGSNPGSMRTMMRLQPQIMELSAEELAAALHEIEALETTVEIRRMLENLLVQAAIEKDPQLVLERFKHRLHDQETGMMWQLSSALGKWADDNPAGAAAWLDREIEAGTFDSKSLDGRSQARLRSEAMLAAALLKSDPAAAERRISAIPVGQREELFRQIPIHSVDPETYASFVRQSLPDQDQAARALANSAADLVHQGGYDRVSKFMVEAAVSPEERAQVVEQAATRNVQRISWQKGVDRSEIDKAREWISSQTPGSEDRITGRMLSEAARHGQHVNFADAAAMAVEYHEKSGNDDVLATFLQDHSAKMNKELARPLLDKISDPEVRHELSENLK